MKRMGTTEITSLVMTTALLSMAACSSGTPTNPGATTSCVTDGGTSACAGPDASVKPIVLPGINPMAIAPTIDGTRVLVSFAGAPGASSGGLSSRECNSGIQAISAATKQSIGTAPTETASVSGDAGSTVTVGWYSSIAVASATKGYAIANDSSFSGSAIYRFDPMSGANVTAVTLSPARNGCTMGELAIDADGGRLFATCSFFSGGFQIGVLSVNTTTDTETASEFITTSKNPQSVAVFPADGGTLLIAMTDNSIGSLGRVTLGASLGTLSLATSTIGLDPVVRVVSSGTTTHAIVLNRNGMSGGTGTNSVQFLDPANNFETAKITGTTNNKDFSTGQGSNPVDVVAGSASEIWVSLLNVPDGGLIAMNTTSGAVTKSIDLVSFGCSGNLPRANAMAVVGDRIWVTLQNSNASFSGYGLGKIVLLNPTTGTLEAAP
ncbi:MAG: hypothetical protein HYY84_18400 [Deltaproteobacteria bacterium]|nr:hypothetical protein [Deltaproteobacteria bacterium]